MEIKRGDIVYCDLYGRGSVQKNYRPCLVVSNNKANVYSPVITVLPITSKRKRSLPTHVAITLEVESYIMAEQIMSIDKCQIDNYYGYVNDATMTLVEIAMNIQLNINDDNNSLLIQLNKAREELLSLKNEMSEKVLIKHKG